MERSIAAFAVAAGFGLLVAGAIRFDLLDQLEINRITESFGIAGLVLVSALLIARRFRVRPVVAAALVTALLYLPNLGVAGVVAVLILAATAMAIGSLLLERDTVAAPWLALVLGLGLIAGILGWLLPLRVHFGALYLVAGLGCVVWRQRVVLALARQVAADWRRDDGSGWVGAFCLAVAASVGTTTWLPTTQFDDLNYHLGLPWQLAELGHYRMDPASQIWALSAWSGDVLHAVVQLLAAREARGPLNVLYLVTLAHLLYALARQCGLSARVAWLTVGLAISQPMTAALGFSMQTELASAMVIVAAAFFIQSMCAVSATRDLVTVAVLCAFALGLKITNLIYVGPLAVWFLIRASRLPWRGIARALALAVMVGGSSYCYSALLAGNPVLPLYNDLFGSEFFDASRRLRDPRYVGLLSWDVPWRLVMDTSTFFESWDGSSGFQWLVLLGPMLLAARNVKLRPLLVVGLTGTATLFSQMQYLRYLYPGLMLLSVPLLGGLGRSAQARLFLGVIVTLMLANLACITNSHWQARDGALGKVLGVMWGERAWLAKVAPERIVARYLRDAYGDRFRVLFPQADYFPAAELAGYGYVVSGYDSALNHAVAKASEDASGVALGRLALDLGVTHVLIQPRNASTAILEMTKRYAEHELSVGVATLYRIRHPAIDPVSDEKLAGGVRVVEFPLSNSGPVMIDVDIALHCTPSGGGILARWTFLGDRVEPKPRGMYELCDAQGLVQFRGGWELCEPADRLQLYLEPGQHPIPAQFDIESIEVVSRRDLAAERDLSAVIGREPC